MQEYFDFCGIAVGDSLPPLKIDPITKVQLVRYAGASGDFNPLHTDDAAAQKAGVHGVIAQGLLIMGFVGQAIGGWVDTRCLQCFKVRFMGMTYPGDEITVGATVMEKEKTQKGIRVNCETTAWDQNGEVKVKGAFEVIIPEVQKEDTHETE